MARRTDIIEAFIAHLGSNTDVLTANVYRVFKYLDDVNDFPAITFVPRRIERDHRGAGRQMDVMGIDLRIYVYDGDTADIAAECERLAEQVEEAIDTFAAANRALEVEEARVATLRTDDGLMSPYGIADIQLAITYEVEITT
jgi:hypothetical protein